MKKGKLLLMSLLASALVVGGTLVSCTGDEEEPSTTVPDPDGDITTGGEDDNDGSEQDPDGGDETPTEPTEPTEQNLTVTKDSGISSYKLKDSDGNVITTSTVLSGTEVTLSNVVVRYKQQITSVTLNGTTTLTADESGNYTFTMPSEDAEVAITTTATEEANVNIYVVDGSTLAQRCNVYVYSHEVLDDQNLNPADYEVTDLLGDTNFYTGQKLAIYLELRADHSSNEGRTYARLIYNNPDSSDSVVTLDTVQYTFNYTDDSGEEQTLSRYLSTYEILESNGTSVGFRYASFVS